MASTKCINFAVASGQWLGKGGVVSLSTDFTIEFNIKRTSDIDFPIVSKYDSVSGYTVWHRAGGDIEVRFRNATDFV